MASVLFGNTIDMLTVATPSSGYIVAYDLDGVLKQKDEFGVITEIGGGPINISGTGSVNFIPKWDSTYGLSSTSSIYDDGNEVVFSAPIIPGTDDVYDIGSSASRWKDLYLGSVVDFKEDLDFSRDGDNIAQINEDGITVNQDKEFSIISGASFQTVEEFDLTTEVAIPYPYIIKVGSRIFIGTYNKTIYEFDEDLNLVDDYGVNDYYFGLQYNPTLNRLYLGGWEYSIGEKYYLDLTTDSIITATTLSERPTDYIAFNQLDNRIYTVNYIDGTLDFYDEDYNYIGGEPLPGGTDTWGITTNQQNGKIYLSSSAGLNGQVLIYESTLSGVDLIETVVYTGESFGIYDSFGADYDNDRNRAYVAINDFIAVIDGDTDSSIATIDISSYGNYIRSIRYFDNQIIVTVNNTTSPANTYLLSINPDTYAITQIKSDTVNNLSLYNSGIYDGSHYYAIINQNSLIKVDDEGTDNLAKIVSSNLTETVTHILQAKSGILAHLDDIPGVLTGKTVWVDATYGNNTTAEPYRFDLPYATINAATNAALSGDLVYIRPGTYSETVTLKDGVNFWADLGVTVNRIFYSSTVDLGLVSSFLGHAKIVATNINAIQIRGGLDISVRVKGISVTGSTTEAIRLVANSPDNNIPSPSRYNIEVEDDILVNTTTGRVFAFRSDDSIPGNENPWKVKWGGRMEGTSFAIYPTAGAVNMIYDGDFFITSTDGSGVSPAHNSKWVYTGNITNLQTHTSANSGGGESLISCSSGELIFSGNLISNNVSCVDYYTPGRIKVINSNIYAENTPPLKITNGWGNGGRTIIENSIIKDGPGNTQSAVISMENSGRNATLIIKDSFIIKDDTLSPTGSVIYKENTSGVSIINSTIICGASQNITETDSITNGEFYFKGTDSNKELGINTINVGADLYENNTKINYID